MIGVRVATNSDIEAVQELLSEAAAWLASRGIVQWPSPFPREVVAASVEAGETYVAFANRQMEGSVALLEADPSRWGAVPDDALYVHRLVASRTQAVSGVAQELLKTADLLVRERGRIALRLDCGRDNISLRRFYEHHGFRHVRDVSLPDLYRPAHVWDASLYERPAQ